MERLPKDHPDYDPLEHDPDFKINPRIDADIIRAEADRLLAKMTTDDNGVFLLQKGNVWMQQARDLPEPTMLFDELWHEGELCILFADTNVGKSILAVQIADSISQGLPINGLRLEAPAQPVVYFDFELYSKQFEARYSRDYDHQYTFHENFYRAEIHPNMELPEGCNTFEDCLNRSLRNVIMNSKAKVLIIDNLTYLRTETERAKDALPLMKELKALKQQYNLSILTLAHTPKRDATKPLTRNDLQGSKMLINFCDSSFCIGESHKTQGLRYIKQIKARATEIRYGTNNVILCHIEKPDNFLRFSLAGYGDEWEHLRDRSGDEVDKTYLIQRCKELAEEGMSVRDIAIELGIGKTSVGKYIKL